jgi:hypothetical protein
MCIENGQLDDIYNILRRRTMARNDGISPCGLESYFLYLLVIFISEHIAWNINGKDLACNCRDDCRAIPVSSLDA